MPKAWRTGRRPSPSTFDRDLMARLTESVVEEAALGWIAALGYAIAHGPEIAPGELGAERGDYGLLLEDRLRQALARLNPKLPAEALDDAFRKIRSV